MYKEIAITIIVVILIIIGNIVTQNNTEKSVEEISGKLTFLEDEINKDAVDEKTARKAMDEIETLWKERYETMAYYIEHNELEKVETEIVKVKADVETKEYTMAIEAISNCKFVLQHIKEKNALQIVNIF